jgi:hypothetical protein
LFETVHWFRAVQPDNNRGRKVTRPGKRIRSMMATPMGIKKGK